MQKEDKDLFNLILEYAEGVQRLELAIDESREANLWLSKMVEKNNESMKKIVKYLKDNYYYKSIGNKK